jgi:hypothetical protein
MDIIESDLKFGVSGRGNSFVQYSNYPDFAQMIKWFTENKTRLQQQWRSFIEETGSNLSIEEYCFSHLWPLEKEGAKK